MWGNPVYYALLQIIEQSIEGVGSLDKAAITKYMKTHTFKTLIGEIDIRNQKLNWLYTVGQWQGDLFHAVAGVGVDVDREVKLKNGW